MLDRTSQNGDSHERDVIDVRHPPEALEQADRGDRARALRDKEPDERSKRQSPRPEDDERDDDAQDQDQQGGLIASLRKHKIAVAAFLVVLAALIVAGFLWYMHARHFESTDDAFIDGRPVSISPEVTGNIVSVPVNDNQVVRAGALLARIDPRDYEAALKQAEAQIAQAQASVAVAQAQVDAQKAQVQQAARQADEARAALSFSKVQNARAQQLVRDGAGTAQNAQQTASDLRSKQAAYDASVASLAAANRQIGVLQAQIKNAQAQQAQAAAQKSTAEANLSRTQLHATVDGRVTRLTAAVGAAATPGQALMVLVPTDLWVTANFKETQLAAMKVGQPVDIEVDAFGKTYPGHVNSIQAGSGTAFSLLPAENATGNYVKVVQRVPVKIVFNKPPDVEIGPGMSVVPTVRVR